MKQDNVTRSKAGAFLKSTMQKEKVFEDLTIACVMIRLMIMFLIIYVHWEVVLWAPFNHSHYVITMLSLLFFYSYQLWILWKKILLVLKKHFADLYPYFSFYTFGYITKNVFGHMAWGLQLETVFLPSILLLIIFSAFYPLIG